MSTTTLAQARYEIRQGLTYEIRQGLTGPDQHPHIEGVVDGLAVVSAFPLADASEPRWILAVYQEVASAVRAPHPVAARIVDEDQARQWVELITALYAKATEEPVEPVDVMLDSAEAECAR